MGLKLEVGKYYRDANGEKKGPMRKDPESSDIWDQGDDHRQGDYHWLGDGEAGAGAFKAVDLIAEWTDAPTGPVRTVTRKEIVYGVHGDVEIVEDDAHQGGIGIYINATMNADRIRAAANSMLAVAEALEDQ